MHCLPLQMEMISLDDAAKLLLGDGRHTSMTTRSNVPPYFASIALPILIAEMKHIY